MVALVFGNGQWGGYYHGDYDNDYSRQTSCFWMRPLDKTDCSVWLRWRTTLWKPARFSGGVWRHVSLCNSSWIMSFRGAEGDLANVSRSRLLKPHKRGQMKRVSETFVPVVNSVTRLTWLPLPEGATGRFEHYIVNENGKQIRFKGLQSQRAWKYVRSALKITAASEQSRTETLHLHLH